MLPRTRRESLTQMAVYEIKKANSLKEALNSLDPEHALRTDAELGEFFITRPSSPLVEIRMLLQDTDRPQKFLFTGHRGTGKTTELARLAQSLRDDFFIVHYSVKSVLNLFDLTDVDVILSMGLELIARATRENLAISPAVLSHIQNFTAQITRDTEVGSKDSAEVTGELNAKVVRLQARLHSEDATRETIRKTLSGRLSDLLEQIDILSREVEKATRKRILVIVEDLDKADLETAKKLFYSHANSLQAPEVSAIYTFPIALRHDNDFIQVENSFPEVRSLPILKTRLRDGNHNTPGHEALCDILTRRVDERLFTPAALKCLAEFSSGIPREMIALARRACLDARSKEGV